MASSNNSERWIVDLEEEEGTYFLKLEDGTVIARELRQRQACLLANAHNKDNGPSYQVPQMDTVEAISTARKDIARQREQGAMLCVAYVEYTNGWLCYMHEGEYNAIAISSSRAYATAQAIRELRDARQRGKAKQ